MPPSGSRVLLSITLLLGGAAGGCGGGGPHAGLDSGTPVAGRDGGFAGTTGAAAGTTGSGAGTGGGAAGTTGSVAGTTGSVAGTTGSAAGTTGSVAGSGGGSAPDGGVAGTSGGAGSGGTPIPIASYFAESLHSACGYYARCGLYPDVTTCEAANPPDNLVSTIVADIGAGRVLYDGTRARVCVDSYQKASCLRSGQYAQSALPDPCAGVFTGTVPVGQPCYTVSECAPGAGCFLTAACTMACCVGTCIAPVAQGASCASAPCPAGNYCRPQTLRCTPQSSTEGSVCDALDGCAPPFFCLSDEAGNGTCEKTLPATGAACNAFAGCDDSHDTCNANNVCAKLVGLGQACTTTPTDNCAYYSVCNGAFCQQGGTVGAACVSDPASGATSCLGELGCPTATAKCTAPPTTSCR